MVDKYTGFNDIHLTEKLRAVERIVISRALVRQLRIAAGLPAKRRRRAPKHHRRREREARAGALVLIDGSTHAWTGPSGPVFTLVGAVDDATGRILALAVREHEDLHGYMEMLRNVLREHGVPVAFYGDRFGALVRNDPHWTLEEQLAGEQDPTAFGQILAELGVAFIAARSPQAKGRVERLWGTLQDRLVAEAGLLGLTTAEQVRDFLPKFIGEYNARFGQLARMADAAWRKAPANLDRLLTCRYARQVSRDNTVTVPGRWIQLPARAHGRSWQGCKVELREGLDGAAWVVHQGEVIVHEAATSTPFTLVHRDSGHARRRCPDNFSSMPPKPAAKAVPPPARNRRGQITNMRTQAPDHSWRKSYKRPETPAP
jgi:hypothetical protein